MKTGLIVEGGANRTIFACGVMDALLDMNIKFDYFIGVSAGIANGVSYISEQKGRNLNIMTEFVNDSRYMGLKNMILPNNRAFYGIDFVFNTIPRVHHPFDFKKFGEFEGDVIAVTSNLLTGKADYLKMPKDETMAKPMIASCALPLMFPIQYVNNTPYLDGGVADPIPIKKALEDGCDKVFVILSREYGYRKKRELPSKMVLKRFKKYPNFCETLKSRPALYNARVSIVEALELRDKIKVIRPNSTQNFSRLESDVEKIRDLYYEGYESMIAMGNELKDYLNK